MPLNLDSQISYTESIFICHSNSAMRTTEINKNMPISMHCYPSYGSSNYLPLCKRLLKCHWACLSFAPGRLAFHLSLTIALLFHAARRVQRSNQYSACSMWGGGALHASTVQNVSLWSERLHYSGATCTNWAACTIGNHGISKSVGFWEGSHAVQPSKRSVRAREVQSTAMQEEGMS